MLHAQPLPASTRWSQTEAAAETAIRSRRKVVGQAMLVTMQMSVFALRITAFLIVFSVLALAQPRERENELLSVTSLGAASASEGTVPAFDSATLPPIESIDAQTEITVFLQSSVPHEWQVVALRRAWVVSPTIRDFKGLEENDWDFEDLNSIPGFGDLGPDLDVRTMVAQIFGEPVRLAALSPMRSNELSSSSALANRVRRLVFGAADE